MPGRGRPRRPRRCARGRRGAGRRRSPSPARRPIRSSAWLTAFLVSASPKRGICGDPRAAIVGDLGVELVARHHPVDHAELAGARAASIRSPRNRNSLACAGAHHPRVGEVLDAGDAHAHHRVGEERVVGGDDEVAAPGEHQPAGDAGALHRGDRRLGQLPPAPAHAEVDLGLAGEAQLARRACRRGPTRARPARSKVGVDVAAGGADVVPGARSACPPPASTMTFTSSSAAARRRRASSA